MPSSLPESLERANTSTQEFISLINPYPPAHTSTLLDASTTGARLLEVRQLCRRSQAKLAIELGLERKAISRYENGVSTIGYEALSQFCRITGVSAAWLIGQSPFIIPVRYFMSTTPIETRQDWLTKYSSYLKPYTEQQSPLLPEGYVTAQLVEDKLLAIPPAPQNILVGQQFATTLGRLLAANEISQVELAERTGIDRKQIGRYLKGENLPHHGNLGKLAEELHVSADFLLGIDFYPLPTEYWVLKLWLSSSD